MSPECSVTSVTALSARKTSMTDGPPELQARLRISVCFSVSLPFCPSVVPWWEWEAWRYVQQRCSPCSEKESWTCCVLGRCFTLKRLRICCLPTNLHPPTVRENQVRPFARLVQQGQDLPRDPSPLERPCLLESLDPPAVKSARHTYWISWIPTL